MFSSEIVDTDAFLEMPLSSQALYFHLGMNGDDDGFVSNPTRITRVIGANKNDLDILIAKRFILTFPSGVVVIKHWRLNNTFRKDRYKKTTYIAEKETLYISENSSYTDRPTEIKAIDMSWDKDGNQVATKWQPNGNQMTTSGCPNIIQVNTKEVNTIQNNTNNISEPQIDKKKRFVKPSVDELVKHLQDWYVPRSKREEIAEDFIRFYESKGWMVGKSPMKNWKMAMSGWVKRAGYVEKDNDVKEMEKDAGCELWKSD